ncbi:IS66 family insertion sequence element accessory protein TnpA [Pararhizobium qamdonense]|uniref:IS66 family insertion sequence element accessory protein TnpA n=1 Tax=Pararhizobium qamdonense TaxID=3031126 RepID=UPI0038B2C9F9
MVAESHSDEMSVSAVARRQGLSPGQLFTWRRKSRKQSEQTSTPMFVPAVMDKPAEMPLRATVVRERKVG